MITHADLLLKYTFPVVGALASVARPFIDRSEMFKIALISAAALAYATPLNIHVLYNGCRTYPRDRVLAAVGRVPVEEYASVVARAVATALWTLLCARWSLPCLSFNYRAPSYRAIRWTPIWWTAVLAAVGCTLAAPGRNTYYAGCVLCWSCPAIAVMWYGAGNYFARKIASSSIAIAVPTLYSCLVCRAALDGGVWNVRPENSLNAYVAEALPLEEALYMFASNALVVLASVSYDKARGMIETHTSEFPERFKIGWRSVRQLIRAFATSECSMPSAVTDDIKTVVEYMDTESTAFGTAIYFCQTGVRLDLLIVYGIFRLTDNMIDDAPDVKEKRRRHRTIERFLDEVFADRKSDYEVKSEPDEVKIDWARYRSELSDVELSIFRAFSRIAFYLPRKPFYDIIAGYWWDIENRSIRNEDDLRLYCGRISGSVGVLFVIVAIFRCADDECHRMGTCDRIVEKTRNIGRNFHIVDIARDIVVDSEKLGRCYVPAEYMDDEQVEMKILCDKKNPRALGDAKLKEYSSRLIRLAESDELETAEVIRLFPLESRGPVLAAFDIYRAIIPVIQSSPTYPTRASVSRLFKCFIGLYSLYIKSIRYVV